MEDYHKIYNLHIATEIVKEFNYLGLLLTKTGNFKRAIKTRNPEKRKIPQSFYFMST
jgi:hypothetical protein